MKKLTIDHVEKSILSIISSSAFSEVDLSIIDRALAGLYMSSDTFDAEARITH